MSYRLWQRPGMTGLDLKGGGAGLNKDVLFAVALGIVVVAAVVVVWLNFGRRSEVVPRMLHMICTNPECKYDFDKIETEVLADPNKPAEPPRIDCPKCKGQRTCVEAKRCPACKRYFSPPSDNGPVICPYCQTDVDKYVAEHIKK